MLLAKTSDLGRIIIIFSFDLIQIAQCNIINLQAIISLLLICMNFAYNFILCNKSMDVQIHTYAIFQKMQKKVYLIVNFGLNPK